MKCPKCGYVENECEVSGCHEPSEWEGWWRAIGPFGLPTGLIQRRRVCEAHKILLIGHESNVASNDGAEGETSQEVERIEDD